jgi:Tfp pilus assembly protein FimT
MPRRSGTTLIEQVVVLAVLGVFAATGVVAGARLLDTATVHGAARDVSGLLELARDRAMATGTATAVQLDAPHRRLVVHAGADTIARLELGPRAVALSVSRDSIAYTATGLGFGAANLRAIITRGASADTVTVSRLGRVKR